MASHKYGMLDSSLGQLRVPYGAPAQQNDFETALETAYGAVYRRVSFSPPPPLPHSVSSFSLRVPGCSLRPTLSLSLLSLTLDLWRGGP